MPSSSLNNKTLVPPDEPCGVVIFDLEGTLLDPETRQTYSGINDLLAGLCSKGLILFVWTRGGRSSSIELLKQLDLMRFFCDISCADDEFCKPDPRSLREVMGEQLRPLPGVVMGDGQSDQEGARNLGWPFLLAAWQSENPGAAALPERFQNYRLNMGVCSSPTQALSLIESYFRL